MASKSNSAIPTTTPLLLLLLLLFLTLPFSSTACTKEDFQALVGFKETLPKAFPGWGDTPDCCKWAGNIARCKNGRVTSLTLSSDYGNDDVFVVELDGSLPPSLGDLSALTDIFIYEQPNLHGHFPHNWSKLKNLKSIYIQSTNISGPVPSFFSQLTSLQDLYIDNCKLTGAIPPSLGNLVNLNRLAIRKNKLTGTIPSTLFSRLKKGMLADLDLSNNQLTGAIPKSFGSVPFSGIELEFNKLTGDASCLFGKSKPLVQMLLNNNKLSFDLTNVEYPVKNLDFLDISTNEIYGSINEQITQVQHEFSFEVSNNKLCGKIPRGGKFTPTNADSFADNKCLCGNPLPACK